MFIAYSSGEGSDELAHMRSLVTTFATRTHQARTMINAQA